MRVKLFPDNIFTTNESYDVYYKNLFYKDYILDKENYPYHFDDWYNFKNYGKIDLDNDVIYPKKNFLKSYKNNNNVTQQNICFVTDAFLDLKRSQADLVSTGKISENNIYNILNVVESTANAEDLYIDYVQKLYKIFEEIYLSQNKEENPYSIQKFIEKFIFFLKTFLKIGVINRSSFFKGKAIPRSIDGLRISFDKVDNINDVKRKANDYINLQGFDFFINNIGRFGFMVDKNRPWSIVFDINSQASKKYIEKYRFKNLNEIYTSCYFKAYKADLENLNNLLLTFWNNYAAKYSSAIVKVESSSCMKVFNENVSLKQIIEEKYNKIFNINWQLRFYFYCRILEEKLFISQEKFEALHSDACKIYKLYSEEESLKFINIKINEISERFKTNSYELTSESEFYRLLEQQTLTFNEDELKF